VGQNKLPKWASSEYRNHAYPPPTNYYFAASKGLGLKLKKLLTKPDELKKELIANWHGYCKTKITDTKEIPLDGALKDYLEKFDFTIFKMIPKLPDLPWKVSDPRHS
jgi:hypothetical protein